MSYQTATNEFGVQHASQLNPWMVSMNGGSAAVADLSQTIHAALGR